MNVEDHDPTVPFYVIVDEDYQDAIPAGTVAVAKEIKYEVNNVAWELRDAAGHYAIVPSGSQAELFLRTGQVARPGMEA